MGRVGPSGLSLAAVCPGSAFAGCVQLGSAVLPVGGLLALLLIRFRAAWGDSAGFW
jgi:hypothetical protein